MKPNFISRERTDTIMRLIEFCDTLGSAGYEKIKEVMENGGKPLSDSAIEILTKLDSVVKGELSPEDTIKAKGYIPIIGYVDEKDETVYSLVFMGELEWLGDWLRFREGNFSLIKEPLGDIITSVNRNTIPQPVIDRLEVVAMTANDAPADVIERRIVEMEKSVGIRRKL